MSFITDFKNITSSFILISDNFDAPPMSTPNYTLLQMSGKDGNPTRFLIDTNNSSSNFGSSIRARRTRGTSENPLAILQNDVILQLVGDAYNSQSISSNSVNIAFLASQNWNTSSQGTYITFRTTQNNTTTGSIRLQINNDGHIHTSHSISASQFKGNLTGTSSYSTTSSYALNGGGGSNVSSSYALTASYSLNQGINIPSYDYSNITYNGPLNQISDCTYRYGGEFGTVVCIVTAIYSGSIFTGISKSLG